MKRYNSLLIRKNSELLFINISHINAVFNALITYCGPKFCLMLIIIRIVAPAKMVQNIY